VYKEQRSLVHYLWAKGLDAKDIHKEIFPVYDGKFVSRKAVQPWWQSFADDKEVETEVRKWLRQQSEDFHTVGFDALVKRCDKCINIGGRCVEK
jgi:hypothetical protein